MAKDPSPSPQLLGTSEIGILLKISKPTPITLIFTYIPPDKHTCTSTTALFNAASSYQINHGETIILGDFNARTGTSNTSPLLERNSKDGVYNKKGRSLLSAAAEHGLVMCNGSLPGDPDGEFT